MIAGPTGSVSFDVWACAYSDYNPPSHPAGADLISAAAPPTVTSALKSQDVALSGWTTAVSAGSILRAGVTGCTGVHQATLSLKVTKT